MKATTQSKNGTSFHNVTITASPKLLKQLLGEPEYENNTGEDKVNMEWVLETEDGDVFTVYDWKEGRPIKDEELIEWHIGGKNKMDTITAKIEILDSIGD
jgi:hypothetical protein